MFLNISKVERTMNKDSHLFYLCDINLIGFKSDKIYVSTNEVHS